jgi:hypothetical protein
MIDPTYRIVPPPVDVALTAVDLAIRDRILIIDCVIILAALLFALREWNRSKSPMLLLLVVGGAFTALAEPFVDLCGACWHPIIGQDGLYENMDRPIPTWLLTSYLAYFGVLPMFIYNAFRKGAGTRTMWLWFLIPVVADIILEESLLSQSDHLYVYYANQPLKLHTFPLWWAASNTIGVYLSAVVMVLFTPLLRGWKLVLVPFSTLLCYTASAGFVAWPATVVINSEFSPVVTQLGGIMTFAIAFLVVHGCTRLIASDSPHDFRKALGARPA